MRRFTFATPQANGDMVVIADQQAESVAWAVKLVMTQLGFTVLGSTVSVDDKPLGLLWRIWPDIITLDGIPLWRVSWAMDKGRVAWQSARWHLPG